MKYIGFGCFHFGIKHSEPFEFDPQDYCNEVKKALELVPSITEIGFNYDLRFNEKVYVDFELPNIQDGDFFPRIVFFKLSFKVYIPARVQEQILGEEWAHERTQSEHFKVYISNSYHGPVTFIETINPDEECDPSYSVRVVRTFLESEFLKLNTFIRFEYLGPSPFHADFFLEPVESETDLPPLSYEEIELKGYNTFHFKYNKKIFDTEEKGLLFFIDSLTNELSLFYEIIREKNELIDRLSDLSSAISEAIDPEDPPKGILSVRSKWQAQRKRHQIIGEIYKFKAETQMQKIRVKEAFNSTYERSGETYLKSHTQAAIERLPSYPVEPLQDWLIHNDSRLLKNLEIFAIIASALLGGITGSLITVAIQ